MAIEFKVYTSVNRDFDEKPIRHARIISKSLLSQDKSNVYISDRSSLTDSDMEAALKAIRTQMRLSFKAGNSIKFGDMGTLKPRIKVSFDKNGKIIKGSERVFKVDFIPAASLIRDFADFEFKCIGYVDISDTSFETRLAKYLSLFKDGAFFSIQLYASTVNTSLRTSNRDMIKIIEMGYAENVISLTKGVYRRISPAP